MANPDVALAFQNPRVQQAIMDVCPTLITAEFNLKNELVNVC